MKMPYLSPCLAVFASVPKEIIPASIFHATFGFVAFHLSVLFPTLGILVYLAELHMDAAPGLWLSCPPLSTLFPFWHS